MPMFARRGLALFLAGWALSAYAGPQIQHWQTDNGARVYFVEARELPIVQIRVVFDAGSAKDSTDKSGLAALTSRTLDEGAGELDADQIALRFEGLGAEFAASSLRDMAIVELRSLSERNLLAPAVALLTQILSQPSFPPASLERERRRALTALEQARQSPAAVANKTFYEGLFGGHPYARYPGGSTAGLNAVSRADLVAFHQRYYVAANAVVALVGDLSRRDAKKLAARLVSGLARGEAAAKVPPVAELPRAVERRIAFPSSQTHLLLGQPGIRRGDVDYFPLYVGNYILGGGGLVSRLSEEVRERQGLVYSVYSYFSPMRDRGPFVVGLQTRNTQIGKALGLVRKIVTDFVATGPTAEELTAAKRYLMGGFPLRIDSNEKIAEYLAVIGFYGLPLTYLEDFVRHIEAVTVEQVSDAFRRRVKPEKMLTVIVGGG